ncbi:unnamed protein product [Effrenium voratum]|uniref:Uncharacterized protein n=1 Tax=Effrenium voratum TaxID=2562239 RepID=A0AA36IUN6_9DINO|nr:unnamed protein product [Effrenium voratum]
MKVGEGADTLRIVNEFKQQLKSKIKHMEKKSLLVMFPDNPRKLPKDIYDAVFEEELPSPPQNSAGAESSKVVARKSHSLVKKVSLNDNPMSSMMQQMDHMMKSNMGGVNPMMLMMAGIQQFMGADKGDAHGAANLQIFGNKRKTKALPNAAEADRTSPEQKALLEGALEDDSQESRKTQSSAAEMKPPNQKPAFEVPIDEEASAASASAKKKAKTPEEYVKVFKTGVQSRERARAEAKQDVDEPEDGAEASEPEEKQPKAKKRRSEEKVAEKKEATFKKPAAKEKAKKAPGPKKAAAAPQEGAAEGAVARKDLGPKPAPPDPWTETFFWGTGKIHKNPKSAGWRAFVDKADRIDRKVKLGDDHVKSFHRALEIIEEGMAARGL